MTHIPAPVVEVPPPALFSPSQFAVGPRCLLRAVLGSLPSVPKLDAHPAAAVGRVLHELLERASKGEVDRSIPPEKALEAALETILEDARANLTGAIGFEAPDLRAIYCPLVWQKKRRIALDIALRLLPEKAHRNTRPSREPRSLRELPLSGRWVELKVPAPRLRLTGRMDSLERAGNCFTVRDLKTGRVSDSSGEILPQIATQIRLYALMLWEHFQSAEILLVIDHGFEHVVAFDAEQVDTLRQWLAAALARVPAGVAVLCEALASPGEACSTCAHRHVCPAYRSRAPLLWQSRLPYKLPLDTWGQIDERTNRENGLVDLRIRDAGDRFVRVFGVRATHLPLETGSGDYIWLFGLATEDQLSRNSGRHPLNYFHVPDDPQSPPAWTLQVFTE